MMVCNSLALKAGGVTRDTPNPSGGVIVKDAKGEPTGVLKDTAMDLVWKQRPERTLQEVVAGLRAANKHAGQSGVTSVQDLAGGPLDVLGWDALRLNRELTVRVNYRPLLSTWPKPVETKDNLENDEWLRIGGVKAFMDGALGAGTALMFAPFDDDPGNYRRRDARSHGHRGSGRRRRRRRLPGRGPRDRRQGQRGDPGHLRAGREKNGPKDRRFRIEHAQHLRADDIPRFAAARRDPVDAALPRGRRRPLGGPRLGQGAFAGRPTPSARSWTRRPRSRSAPTGTSRRSRRSWASRPRSHAPRSTASSPAVGSRSRRSRPRKRSAPIR